MSAKKGEFTLFCGECFKKFVSEKANEELRDHVKNDPCPGYKIVKKEKHADL